MPLVGTAFGALVGWIVGKIAGFINADCDGVVAAELAAIQGGDLWTRTADGASQFHTNHVVTSPAGCNTSNYTVTWTVQRVVRTVISALNDSAGVMHLFAVGENGAAFTRYAKPGQDWFSGGWLTIPGGTFSQGTPITSVFDKNGVMHLFAVGQDGRVYTQFTNTANPFNAEGFNNGGWVAIVEGVFSQGTTVSALLDRAGVMNLFAAGESGAVFTQSSKPFEPWNANGWQPLPGGTFNPGTVVTSLLDGAGTTHLFAVGEDGQIWTIYGAESSGWNQRNWQPVPSRTFKKGMTITPLLDHTGAIHLFAVAEDGHAATQSATPPAAWNPSGWTNVSTGVFT